MQNNHNPNFLITHKIFIINLIIPLLLILFTFFNRNLDSPSILKFNNQTVEILITKIGDKNLIFTNAIALSFILIKKDYQGLFLYIKTFIPLAITTEAIKRLVKRERPNKINTKSFPSGHSALSFIAFIFIFFRYGFKVSLPFLLITLFIGYSRISTNWHYISDVLSGFLLSYIFTYILKQNTSSKFLTKFNFLFFIITVVFIIFNLLLLIILLK